MKFTKEDAYKELVRLMTAKGEKLNLSERSFNEQLEKLIPLVANDETELADFVSNTMPFFQTADANVRNDVSVSIKEYKEKNPVTQTPNKPNENKVDEGNESELEARLAKIEADLAAREKAVKVQETKSQLVSKMKEKGIKSDKWIKAMVGEVNVTDDFDIEAKSEDFLKLYNDMLADYNPNATPNQPSGSKSDYINDAIKGAASFAKSQNLVDME